MGSLLKLREGEKEERLLLSFTTELAAVTNRNDLLAVLTDQLKELFSITGFGMALVREDDQLDSLTTQDYNIDYVCRLIINVDEPLLLPIDKSGVERVLGIPLRTGSVTLGCLLLHLAPGDAYTGNDLLKMVCAQISVAVSRIRAAGEIAKSEQEKSMLLALVNQQLSEIKKYKEQLEEEKIYLKEEIETSLHHAEIIGESPEIKKVFRMIAQVAYTDSTVLLLGETGTGKELIARAIHNTSPRKTQLMIKVNCAAIPANLIESELFGHERGSFTGAVERRIGKFELVNNGTLFLDEIGEMTLDVQVKLLRALQEKEIERVGGKATIKTDVRIIAATNRDLEKLMEEGKFRIDLYYRLNTFPITIPPLRNRKDDISKLALYFIERYSKKAGKNIKAISNKVVQELMQYDWPGNIRELEHLIERSVLLASGDSITEIHLPHQKRNSIPALEKDEVIKTISQIEKEHILKVLKYVRGRIGGKGGAAELLGLPTSTLNSRIKKLGIRREHM